MKSLNELATITKCVMIDIKDIYVPYGEFMSLVNKKFIQKFTLLHCYVHNVKTHTYSHVHVRAHTHVFHLSSQSSSLCIPNCLATVARTTNMCSITSEITSPNPICVSVYIF